MNETWTYPVEPLPATRAAVLRRLWAIERAINRFDLREVGRRVRWDSRGLQYRPLSGDPDCWRIARLGNALRAQALALEAAARHGARYG